jgi:hypothetical protein
MNRDHDLVAESPGYSSPKRPKRAPAKTPRPNCRYCGKPLRRAPDYIEARTGKSWGDYGDDSFCGLRHGYLWAVQLAAKWLPVPAQKEGLT